MQLAQTTRTARRDPLAVKPDPGKAAEACRKLIAAHMAAPECLAEALVSALAAFQLDPGFIESEGGRWQ